VLSGFVNGIFLILISVFFVIEALQRLIHPPHMNTDKLLVVSFFGLVVNLVGMFVFNHGHAEHGHHHHHHHHGHDHHHHHNANMEGIHVSGTKVIPQLT
jgi:zinc transporter 5/7